MKGKKLLTVLASAGILCASDDAVGCQDVPAQASFDVYKEIITFSGILLNARELPCHSK